MSQNNSDERINELEQQVTKTKADAWDAQQELLSANKSMHQQAEQLMQLLAQVAKIMKVTAADGTFNANDLIDAANKSQAELATDKA